MDYRIAAEILLHVVDDLGRRTKPPRNGRSHRAAFIVHH
jgi:hypothetical protein